MDPVDPSPACIKKKTSVLKFPRRVRKSRLISCGTLTHFSKSLRSTEYTAQQSGPRVLELKKTPIPEDEVVVVLEEDAKTHSREDKVVVVLEEDAKSHIREDEVVMVLEEDAETPSHIAGKTK